MRALAASSLILASFAANPSRRIINETDTSKMLPSYHLTFEYRTLLQSGKGQRGGCILRYCKVLRRRQLIAKPLYECNPFSYPTFSDVPIRRQIMLIIRTRCGPDSLRGSTERFVYRFMYTYRSYLMMTLIQVIVQDILFRSTWYIERRTIVDGQPHINGEVTIFE